MGINGYHGVVGMVGNSVLARIGLLLLKYFWKAVSPEGDEGHGGAVVGLLRGSLGTGLPPLSRAVSLAEEGCLSLLPGV